MPTYDYVCDACEHQFELFQSIKADPERTCPQCGKRKLRRLIGPGAALLFKGSGFYITDYRSTNYQEKAKADSPAKDGTSASGGGKGDASPAAASSKEKSTPRASGKGAE